MLVDAAAVRDTAPPWVNQSHAPPPQPGELEVLVGVVGGWVGGAGGGGGGGGGISTEVEVVGVWGVEPPGEVAAAARSARLAAYLAVHVAFICSNVRSWQARQRDGE